MPPTKKGLVGSIACKERVSNSRESEITRGSRQHTRGASSTYCRGPLDSCWCRHQSTAKRTPDQSERQFTTIQGRCWCARVRLLSGPTLPDLDFISLRFVGFLDWCFFIVILFHTCVVVAL